MTDRSVALPGGEPESPGSPGQDVTMVMPDELGILPLRESLLFPQDAELDERTGVPGVAIGLAWTPAGGDVLFVEASKMLGGKSLTLTGHLGDVMKESAHAAVSWVRAHAAELGIDPAFWREHDLHLHVPAGAIPKDGPSAGITLATALVSLLSDRPVRPRLAMTGELTLTGRVLPVGGIKEKVLAAHRAGITTVILPRLNEMALREDVPADVRARLAIHLVSTMDEVLDLAVEPAGGAGTWLPDLETSLAGHDSAA